MCFLCPYLLMYLLMHKGAGPSELKLQITINTEKTVLELKQAIAEKSDVSADRQRLIYSGRVLKVRRIWTRFVYNHSFICTGR